MTIHICPACSREFKSTQALGLHFAANRRRGTCAPSPPNPEHPVERERRVNRTLRSDLARLREENEALKNCHADLPNPNCGCATCSAYAYDAMKQRAEAAEVRLSRLERIEAAAKQVVADWDAPVYRSIEDSERKKANRDAFRAALAPADSSDSERKP